MKNFFCKSLRDHAMDRINIKKKIMKLLKNEQQKLYENEKKFKVIYT